MSEGEAKVIIGTLKSWPFPNEHGWMRFEVDIGKQYPVRLETKIEAVIEQVKKLGTDEGAWHFTESDGNPNPNSPGTFYKNRLLGKVEPVSGDGVRAAATSASSGSGDSEKMTKADWDNKDRRDYRSRSWAQTISALPKEEGETDVDYFLRLQKFQRKVYGDITGTFGYPEDGSDVPFE